MSHADEALPSLTTISPLVLASASPRRLVLLRQLGLEPALVVAPEIDERPLRDELPPAYAQRIAQTKAAAAAALPAVATLGSCIVLAADTVVACGRRILPKAESDAEVRGCLDLLSGRRHRVITAVVLLDPSARATLRLSTSQVRMKRLTGAEIEAYVACGEGRGKAGGYAIQGRAAAFTPWLSGSYTNVVGLPLFETFQMLSSHLIKR